MGVGDIGPEGSFCLVWTECLVFSDFLWSDDIFFLENFFVCVVIGDEFVEVDEVFFGEVENGIVIA